LFEIDFVHIFVHIKVQNFPIMLTTTISDFRKDIKRYFDKVTENFETLIINRGKDNGIVIMSLAEYNSLCATQHELSSKENEKRLDSAIEKLKSADKNK
jgi:antitoxin YefM